MSSLAKEPLVIYLDQKCWIELAKIQNGNPSENDKTLLSKMKSAVAEDRAIFPLTLSNMDEAYKIQDEDRRAKLASIMIELSKGYSFQPYIERNLRAELVNVILRKYGAPPAYIRGNILKQGISNMVGAKGTLVPKKGAQPLPEEIKTWLLDLTENPEAIEFLITKGSPKKAPVARESDINAMETIRRDLWKVKDNNLRYRVFLAKNISELVLPELAKMTAKYNLPPDLVVRKGLTRKEWDSIFDSLPTALCLFTLIYHRDQQRSRPIQANDFNDIWFLTLTIPYSDIVVTERMWTSIATRSKLDKKCGTKIFHSIQSLESFL